MCLDWSRSRRPRAGPAGLTQIREGFSPAGPARIARPAAARSAGLDEGGRMAQPGRGGAGASEDRDKGEATSVHLPLHRFQIYDFNRLKNGK